MITTFPTVSHTLRMSLHVMVFPRQEESASYRWAEAAGIVALITWSAVVVTEPSVPTNRELLAGWWFHQSFIVAPSEVVNKSSGVTRGAIARITSIRCIIYPLYAFARKHQRRRPLTRIGMGEGAIKCRLYLVDAADIAKWDAKRV